MKHFDALNVGQIELDASGVSAPGIDAQEGFHIQGVEMSHPEEHEVISHVDMEVFTGEDVELAVAKAHPELHAPETHTDMQATADALNNLANPHAEAHSIASHAGLMVSAAYMKDMVSKAHAEHHAPESHPGGFTASQLQDIVTKHHPQVHTLQSHGVSPDAAQLNEAVLWRHPASHTWGSHTGVNHSGADLEGMVAAAHVQGTDTSFGPLTQNLNMGGHKITNLADPVDAGDLVNKGYLDALSGGGGSPGSSGNYNLTEVTSHINGALTVISSTGFVYLTGGYDHIVNEIIGGVGGQEITLLVDNEVFNSKITLQEVSGKNVITTNGSDFVVTSRGSIKLYRRSDGKWLISGYASGM
jgi:hypothetical protein